MNLTTPDTWHISPVNDLQPHILSEDCSCCPRIIEVENGSRIVVHGAWDGRDALQEALDILNPTP